MKYAIVLNFVKYQQTLKCVDEMLNTTINKIVVVDNCSPNDSFGKLESAYGNNDRVILLSSSKNYGYARGNNIGMEWVERSGASPGDIVYVVNPDSHVTSDAVDTISSFIGAKPDSGMVSILQKGSNFSGWKRMRTARELLYNSRIFCKFAFRHGLSEQVPYDDLKPDTGAHRVDIVSGAFFGINFASVQKVGYFDSGTFLYYEEEALSAKLRKIKLSNYVLTSTEYEHVGQASSNISVGKLLTVNEQSRLYVLKKYYDVGKIYEFLYITTNLVDRFLWSNLHREK